MVACRQPGWSSSRWVSRVGRRVLRGVPARVKKRCASMWLHCTHHDAYRFFTAAARPRNAVAPTRADQVALEQPGCLHATMDLYKWAYKLSPATPGDLLADCFTLAADVRTLDMRASPYDLAAAGYPPVRIETPAGRAEYARAQAAFARRAAPLRQRLVDLCAVILRDPDPTSGTLVG